MTDKNNSIIWENTSNEMLKKTILSGEMNNITIKVKEFKDNEELQKKLNVSNYSEDDKNIGLDLISFISILGVEKVFEQSLRYLNLNDKLTFNDSGYFVGIERHEKGNCEKKEKQGIFITEKERNNMKLHITKKGRKMLEEKGIDVSSEEMLKKKLEESSKSEIIEKFINLHNKYKHSQITSIKKSDIIRILESQIRDLRKDCKGE